jgi:hypothetical protein
MTTYPIRPETVTLTGHLTTTPTAFDGFAQAVELQRIGNRLMASDPNEPDFGDKVHEIINDLQDFCKRAGIEAQPDDRLAQMTAQAREAQNEMDYTAHELAVRPVTSHVDIIRAVDMSRKNLARIIEIGEGKEQETK